MRITPIIGGMRVRLFTLLLVPAAAALILALLFVSERSSEHDAAETALAVADLADRVEPLDDALGNEALAATLLIQPDDSVPKDVRLLGFRLASAETDRTLARLVAVLEDGTYRPEVAASVAVIDTTLGFRGDVEKGFVSPLQILDRYSYLRTLLLDGLSSQITVLTTAESQQQILALVNLIEVRSAHLDERVGVDLARRYSEWAPGLHSSVVVSVARQQSNLENASRLIGDDLVPEPGPTLRAWREQIVISPDAPGITARAWNALSDSWIHQLGGGIDRQRNRTRDILVKQESAAASAQWLTATGVTVSLAIAMFIASVVSVRIVRRVSIITRQARRMASGASTDRTYPDVRGSDELGQLASAFDEMTSQIDTRTRNQWIESTVLELIVHGRPVERIMSETAVLLGLDEEGRPLYEFSCEPSRPGQNDDDTSHGGSTPVLRPSVHNPNTAVPISAEVRTAVGLIAMTLQRDADHTKLEWQANRDELTGLLNRGAVLSRAMTITDPSDGSESRPALLYIDLDDFKGVNDQFGHAAGDRVLTTQADRVRNLIEPFDGAVGRLGGDEFLVMLPSVKSEAALEAIAGELVELLSRPIQAGGGAYQAGASIGCVLTRPGVPPLKLLADADAALYEAKRQGRGRSLLSTQELRDLAVVTEQLRRDVPVGIAEGQFVPWFQPIWSDDGSHLIGMEALARWEHPERGLISPGVFLPVAEELHLLAELDRTIFEQVCHQAVSWGHSGLHLEQVHYNLSTAWLEEPDFVAQTKRVFAETGCRPEFVVAEVTESGLMTDISSNCHRLQALREIGVEIAVDDFGQGYSSLAYLSDLPVDLLKIDRRFVDHIDTERSNQAIVSAVLSLGESLDLQIVAEGVERPEELEYLIEAGCHLFQGFLLAKPLPGPEASALLGRTRQRVSELEERLSFGSIDELVSEIDDPELEADPT